MPKSKMKVFKKYDISGFFDEIQDPLFIFRENEIIYFNQYFREFFKQTFTDWKEFFDDPEIINSIRSFFYSGEIPNSDFVKPLPGKDGGLETYQWVFINLPSPDQNRTCIAKGRRNNAMSDLMNRKREQSLLKQQSLQKQVDLENLINRISSKFINSGLDEFDRIFRESLKMLGEFQKADRTYLCLIHDDFGKIEVAYEWVKSDRVPAGHFFDNNPITRDLLTMPSLRKGEVLSFAEISEVPDKFEYEKRFFLQQGIKSVVLVPIFSEDMLIGFFGLEAFTEARDWVTEEAHILKQLGAIYAGTFQNKAIKRRLQRNENLLASTEILSQSGSWRFSNSKNRLFFSKGFNRIFEFEDHHYSASLSQIIKRVSKKDRLPLIYNARKAIKELSTCSGEFIIIGKGNKEKFIKYSIQVRKISGSEQPEIYGYCSDVSEKRETENYLRLQSQILAQVNDSIFVTDLNLKIIYMNKAAYQECQIDHNKAFEGKITSIFEFLPGEGQTLEQIIEGIQDSQPVRRELNLRSKDNKVEPYEISIQVFLDESEEKIGYSFLIRNLTLQIKQAALAKKAKMIVENSPAVLFTIDPADDFRIVYISENINQFGYKYQDLIQKKASILDLIHPQDARNIVHNYFNNRHKKDIPSFTGEYRIKRTDGIFRWVEGKTREVYDLEGNIHLHEGLFQDVTERKLNREEVERSKQRYRVLASNIPLTNVFLIDRDHRYIVAEGTIFSKWGMNSEDFEGKTLAEVHKFNLNDIQPVVTRSMIKRELIQNKIVYKNRVYELTVRPIIYDEEVEYALGIVRDINEEHEVKENLKKSEEKYRNLVEESTEIIYSMSADFTYTYISPNVKQFLGYDPEEVTGSNLSDYLHPEDHKVFQQKLSTESDFLEVNQYLEFKLLHKNGRYSIFSTNGKVIRDVDGRFRHYTGIARDITSLKDAQKELFYAKEKAEQASKVKSQFLSVMSHEIRTPMNAVIGMAYLLMEDNPRTDQLENLRTLQFSAENLLGLINDILDYSKIDSGKIELEKVNFDISNVFTRILHSYTYQAKERDLDIQFESDPSIPKTIVGDPVRLTQIVNNLVSNAIKFTEEGFVKLSLTKISENDRVIKIRFNVEDSGIGIPEDKLESIFEAFTQASTDTTRKYGGTGLGLAIVKRLVELFGSTIKVGRGSHGGTYFTFDIDFGKPETIGIFDEELIKIGKKNLKTATILVAEDNLVNQIMIKKFLMKWEVKEICFANDGVEAITAFENKDFNLILLDLQMPEKDGYEVATHIRTYNDGIKSNIPIIALTASTLMEVKEQLEEVGINDYISKPFNPDNLYAKIIKYLKV